MENGKKDDSDKKVKKTQTTRKRAATPAAAKTKPLTAKQADFVREYLIDLNGTRAYLRAYPGVTEGSARALAAKALANVSIQEAIAVERQKTADRLTITRERVLEQYARLAFSDVRELFDENGQIKSISSLDYDTAAALMGFEVEMRQLDGADSPPVPVLKVKWADKKAALDAIMRAQGWNSAEKFEHTGKGGKPLEVVTRVVMVPKKIPAETRVENIQQGDEE